MPAPIDEQILVKLEEIRLITVDNRTALQSIQSSNKWIEKGIYTINLHHNGGAWVELHEPTENGGP